MKTTLVIIMTLMLSVMQPIAATAYYREYNGNISSNLWQDNQGTVRRYDYSYDGLNRLINAAYTETRQSLPQGLAISGTPDYSAMYEYDLNGNATFIRRNGISRKTGNSSAQTWTYDVIDNIYIDYDGNQPLFIDDTENPLLYENAPGCNDSSFEAEEFAWDANGNMTQDLTKGITSITYNMLNLPSVITYDDGHKEYRYYDTDGNQLRTLYQVAITPASSSASAYARYRTEQTRYYCGDVEYVNDSVARVLPPVGYVNARGNNAAALSDYRFYIRDYQGNNRVLTDYRGNAIERYDYYPYGGLFGEVNPEQWRLYGGKELQTVNGLNLHDFHARWQDYATGRFTTLDPMATDYGHRSPYTYCAANPLKYTDSSGEFLETLWDVANVALGIGSFVDNVKQGNVGDAVLDGLGVVVDAAAVILPGVPGGAGAAIKGARAADDVVDAVKSAKVVDKATDANETTKFDSILNEAVKGDKTKGKSKIYRKQGGNSQAEKDFNKLDLTDVVEFNTEYGKSKRGHDSQGNKIILRPGSSEGTPTIEMQKGKKRIKIRYD